MNVRYRIELSQAERCELTAMLSKSASSAKSPHGNDSATAPGPASNGCSQPTKPAPKWAAPIPSHPKSHNHCAEVLVPTGVPREGMATRIPTHDRKRTSVPLSLQLPPDEC